MFKINQCINKNKHFIAERDILNFIQKYPKEIEKLLYLIDDIRYDFFWKKHASLVSHIISLIDKNRAIEIVDDIQLASIYKIHLFGYLFSHEKIHKKWPAQERLEWVEHVQEWWIWPHGGPNLFADFTFEQWKQVGYRTHKNIYMYPPKIQKRADIYDVFNHLKEAVFLGLDSSIHDKKYLERWLIFFAQVQPHVKPLSFYYGLAVFLDKTDWHNFVQHEEYNLFLSYFIPESVQKFKFQEQLPWVDVLRKYNYID